MRDEKLDWKICRHIGTALTPCSIEGRHLRRFSPHQKYQLKKSSSIIIMILQRSFCISTRNMIPMTIGTIWNLEIPMQMLWSAWNSSFKTQNSAEEFLILFNPIWIIPTRKKRLLPSWNCSWSSCRNLQMSQLLMMRWKRQNCLSTNIAWKSLSRRQIIPTSVM